MKQYSIKSKDVLKYYHFLTYLFLPVFSFITLLVVIRNAVQANSINVQDVLTALILPASLVTFYFLKDFKRQGITSLMILNLLIFIRLFFSPSPSDVPENIEAAVSAIGNLFFAVFLVFNFIYFKKRASLFNGLPLEYVEEGTVNHKNKVVSACLFVLLTFAAFFIISSVSKSIVESIGDISAYTNKLLTYPFPVNELPNETPFNAVVNLFEAFISILLCYFLLKARIYTPTNLGIDKKKKPVLSIFSGFFAGLLLAAMAELILMIFFGGRLVPNKLFPRVVFTIITGIPYYLGVAVFEETLFRGLLQNFFTKIKRPILGLLISSVAFMLLHRITGVYTEGRYLFFVLCLGILEGTILLCTNNLWLCMGVHFGYDYAVVHVFESRYLANGNSFLRLTMVTRTEICMVIGILCLLVSVIIGLLYKVRKQPQ